MKKVFISGGAGMIGLALAKHLCSQGYSVVIFDLFEQVHRRKHQIDELKKRYNLEVHVGTIMDRWATNIAMQGSDIVFHLAAMLGVKRTEENKLLCMDINVNGTENIISSAVYNRVKHFVFASSSEVYGDPSQNPVTELSETKGKTVYAVSKLAGEELVKGFSQSCGLNYTIVRFFNTYGEGQVAQFVLSRFVDNVLKGRSPEIYGDGTQTRTYCNVFDTVEFLQRVIENPISAGKIYNIGNSKESYSLSELANVVIRELSDSPDLKPVFLPFSQSDRDAKREIIHRLCDASLAVKELDYVPKISVPDGVALIAQTNIFNDWDGNPSDSHSKDRNLGD